MSKSHVSMEQKKCIVTGKDFDCGSILLDKRMKDSMERNTVTGWGYSPEVEDKFEEGYVALIEIDEAKSTIDEKSGLVKPEGAYRTGPIIYIKQDVVKQLFNIPIKKTMFIDQEITKYISNLEANERE
jgi:hypothetical protein